METQPPGMDVMKLARNLNLVSFVQDLQKQFATLLSLFHHLLHRPFAATEFWKLVNNVTMEIQQAVMVAVPPVSSNNLLTAQVTPKNTRWKNQTVEINLSAIQPALVADAA